MYNLYVQYLCTYYYIGTYIYGTSPLISMGLCMAYIAYIYICIYVIGPLTKWGPHIWDVPELPGPERAAWPREFFPSWPQRASCHCRWALQGVDIGGKFGGLRLSKRSGHRWLMVRNGE